MNIEGFLFEGDRSIDVSGSDRWEVYRRLRSLDIACQCSTYQPLRVSIETANDILQVWSVLRQTRSDRRSLVGWLETCWRSDLENN
ncbi:Asr1405/Asl0597 family protein [Pannus brasiliensis CCIBt3594]|uniref:Asr1405/Asl0597 family protein n=1 Tax=Pannus brasiliensis CCIBt3594 TaxID=1427578 RepID=A0AAW9R1D3_9CHRO